MGSRGEEFRTSSSRLLTETYPALLLAAVEFFLEIENVESAKRRMV